MASCSEQFLKVSLNSVQRSKRSSGLEIGTDGHKDHYIPLKLVCGGYKNVQFCPGPNLSMLILLRKRMQ